MKPIPLQKLITKKWLINLILILCIIVILWLWGGLLNINGHRIFASVLVKVIITLVLLLIYALIYLRFKVDIKKPSTATVNQDQAENIDNKSQLVQLIDNVVNYLKNDRYKQSKNVFWYFLLGAKNSGKTTLLQNSQLSFPEMVNTSSKVENVEYHLSNEAVFLEVSDNENDLSKIKEFWQRLFLLLKGYGLQRRLQAIIITYNINDIYQQSDQEKLQTLARTQAQIREIYHYTGRLLPVYYVFTHVDNIIGFQHFFADLDKQQKQQMWGFTCSMQDTLIDVLNRYQQLVTNLSKRLFLRAYQASKKNHSALAVNFPLQMVMFKEYLSRLLEYTFSESRYHEKIPVRGIFFTSAAQSGTAIDFAMKPIIDKFGVVNNNQLTIDNNLASYFIHDLFHQLILTETQLAVASNQNVQKRNSIYRWCSGIFAVLALGCVSIGLYSYYLNRMAITQLTGVLDAYNAEVNSQTADVFSLQTLANNNETINKLYSSWLNYLGFHQSQQLSQAMNNFYQAQLYNVLMPWLVSSVSQHLQAVMNQPPELYQTLKVYLMLGYPQYRQNSFLMQWLENHVMNQYGNDPSQQLMTKQVLANILQTQSSAPLDQQLIEKARLQLQSVPPVELAYSLLLQNDLVKALPSVTIDETTIPGLSQVFIKPTAPILIPGLYTAVGYQKIYLQHHLLVNQNTLEDWVIGNQQYSQLSITQLQQQLATMYFARYFAYWQQLLTQLYIIKIDNISTATAVVSALSQPSSPLQQLLKLIDDNTAVPFIGNNATATIIPTNFQALHRYFTASSSDPLAFSNTLTLLAKLQKYLNNINNAQNSGQGAYLAAKAIIANPQSTPFAALQQQANNEPAPINGWLSSIMLTTGNIITANATNYLNQIWQTQVYGNYQQAIAGRYPFDKSATTAVTLTDFAHFFGPNGTLDSFIQTYLAPLIDPSSKNWQIQTTDGVTLSLLSTTLATLQTAETIKSTYFSTANSQPTVQFSLKPIDMSSNLLTAQLILGKSTLTYRHDPQLETTFTWPIQDNNGQISFTTIDVQNHRTIAKYDGPWALFKWLDSCQMTSSSNTTYTLTCTLNQNQVRYQLQMGSVVNIFTIPSLSNFTLPDRL